MPKCTLLVGVPGSGKSTWLLENRPKGTATWVASTDNIIQGLADDYGFTYSEIFIDTIRFAEKAMYSALEYAASCGYDIYVDRTNMTAWSRKRFIEKLKPLGYEFECVVFPTPEPEEWKRRLDSRPGKAIPQEVLDRMVDSYEMPLMNEGFTKITYVH